MQNQERKSPEKPGSGRLNYLDLAKGIGIILVILGHIEYIGDALKLYIVAFHMPLFFVISGILIWLRREEERSMAELVKKKLRRMMLPYLWFSVLDILIYIGYYLLTGRDGGWNAVILDILQTVTFYGFSVMWFLPALFLAECLFLFILKRFSRWSLLIVPAVLVAALWMNSGLVALNARFGMSPAFQLFHMAAVALVRALICMGFVAAGYGLSRLTGRNPILSPAAAGAGEPGHAARVLICAFIGVDFLTATFFISMQNGPVDLHYCVFGNVFLYFAGALSGSIGLVLLCKALEGVSTKKVFFPLLYFGRNSLIIMATHMDFYILYVSEVAAFHFIKYIHHAKDYIFNAMIVCFVLAAEVLMIEIINRWLPFLLGAPLPRRKTKREG